MSEGVDWLMRPVTRGLCRYSDLTDGTLDIEDVYRLNEMIDVETENSWRAQRAAAEERKNRR